MKRFYVFFFISLLGGSIRPSDSLLRPVRASDQSQQPGYHQAKNIYNVHPDVADQNQRLMIKGLDHQGQLDRMLFQAIDNQNLQEVEKVVEQGADINVVDPDSGLTPLNQAISLIREKNINWADSDNTLVNIAIYLALHGAIIPAPISEELMEDVSLEKILPNYVNYAFSRLQLWQAINQEDIDKVRIILDENPVFIYHCMDQGQTFSLLLFAIEKNNHDIVKELIKNGATASTEEEFEELLESLKNDYQDPDIQRALWQSAISLQDVKWLQ